MRKTILIIITVSLLLWGAVYPEAEETALDFGESVVHAVKDKDRKKCQVRQG